MITQNFDGVNRGGAARGNHAGQRGDGYQHESHSRELRSPGPDGISFMLVAGSAALKTAVLAPMPSAREITATAVSPGL